MTDITEKNRRAMAQIRRTPMPISDVIPLLCESNDEIEKLRGELALVAAAEREECAKVCDETTASWTQHTYNSACNDCAAAIRARNV